MVCDISIVVFRPKESVLRKTFESLAAVKNDFSRVFFLISGSTQEFLLVSRLLDETGLSPVSVVTHRFDNLGFASGHNLLLNKSFESGSDFCLVLNPDIYIEKDSIVNFLGSVAEDGANALYGPALIRLNDDESAIDGPSNVADSLGIFWNNSARHMDKGQGESMPALDGSIKHVEGVTGACLFVPKGIFDSIVKNSGFFFDDVFLAYREDAELGVRAGLLGVSSKIIMLGGFFHVRSVRGEKRGAVLTDLLGVRNRFILSFRLGRHRPSRWCLGAIRDLVVIVATLLVERTSLPGLRSAFSIRRFLESSSSVRNI